MSDEQNEGKGPAEATKALWGRLNLQHGSNNVRISDAVGAVFLGIVSVILLLALLRLHRRERKWMESLLRGGDVLARKA